MLLVASGCPNVAKNEDRDLSSVRLPPGFRIDVYADSVPGARSLAIGPAGTVFVGSRDLGMGQLYALRDADGDQRAETVRVLAQGLNAPNGVAVKNGALYVAEPQRIIRYDDIEAHLDAPPAPVVITAEFPADGQHSWKYLRFGPDGLLYVPVGMPCNACLKDDPIFGTILRMDPAGGPLSTFASGIRNTVGFDFRPGTSELWFTDNGRDDLGDDDPPDELDVATQSGMNFGFPYCYGSGIQDPGFTGHTCNEFTPPAINLGPHVAALGMAFYTGTMFPPQYQGQIFIAEHGSAHRSEYLGYRLTLVRLQAGKAVSYEVFADGFLQDGNSWARPVDVLVMPDGALLFSDDRSGAVYRISYSG